MKFTTTKDELIKPLGMIGGVVERRQTLPILANVLMKVSGGVLKLTATDLEVELHTQMSVEASEDREFTLPARKLIDICKALPDDAPLSVELSGEKATLRSGRGRYTLNTLSANDYPNLETSAANAVFHLQEGQLRRLIDKVQFAMAQQDVRYYLNGMLLEVRPGRIRAVATDGHRLAMCDAPYVEQGEIDQQVILPRKAVLELGRLLSDSEDSVTVELCPSHLRVTRGETVFISKLIDGKFPEYERVMPRGQGSLVLADREVLRAALARTAILSNEKYRGIRFGLAPGVLQLQAHNPEQDEAEEELEVQYDGDVVNIGFNVSYLLDVLSVIGTEQVQITVVDANSSCLIQPPENDDSRYVVMPMRL